MGYVSTNGWLVRMNDWMSDWITRMILKLIKVEIYIRMESKDEQLNEWLDDNDRSMKEFIGERLRYICMDEWLGSKDERLDSWKGWIDHWINECMKV